MNALRSLLYAIARAIGDLQAIRRGPKAVVKRQIRKAGYRQVGKLFRF